MKKLIIALFIFLIAPAAFAAPDPDHDADVSVTSFPVIVPATNDYVIMTDTTNAGKFGKVTFANFKTGLSVADALGADDNYVTNAEKASLSRLGDLESTDAVTFGSVTGAGSGGLKAGVESTTRGAITLYSNTTPYAVGINSAATPTGTWTLTMPPAAPGGANYLFNVDADGTGGWTDPSTLGGDNLGSATYSNVVSLWTTCSGYLKSDGTCDSPTGTGDMVLADVQSVTGLKTFDSVKLAIKGTSTGTTAFENTNATATNYTLTLPNADGTLARLSDNISGTSAGLSGTPNITVGTISAGAAGFSVNADGDVTAKSYLSSAADGSRRSELPNNTSITPLGGGVEEIYNEGGAIKAVENDTEYDMMLSRDIGGSIQAYDADLDDLADGSLTGSKVSAASDSAAGVSELATTAETNTGTSTSLTVTPDGLSGSVYGQKEIGWYVIASDTVTAVADGKQAAVVPASMNGMNLVDVTCSVHDLNSAASGNTTVVLRRVRGATAVDMTSTGVTIAYTDYTASDETVDTANDDLATGDKIYVDVNAVTSAVQKGLSCTALFQTP